MGQLKEVPTDEDDFEVAGPKHMVSRAVNWRNEEDRRCIAACLVKATWVIENDKRRPEKLAKPWYENFGFRLMEEFPTGSIINKEFAHGAVFELIWTPTPPDPEAPKYVAAFRGTMLHHPNAYQDLKHDFKVLFNALTTSARFEEAHSAVDRLVDIVGEDSICWLAGHSLGASLALDIGRSMMLERDRNVPTFLFNPPHVSAAPVIDSVLNGKHKTRLYTGSYMVKYALANISGHRERSKDVFEKLHSWWPDMYVNPDDWICRGHIDYFEQRDRVAENHPHIASTAMRTSYRDMFFSSKLRPHLLPAATLWINSTQKEDPHGLKHWWKSDNELKLKNNLFCILD